MTGHGFYFKDGLRRLKQILISFYRQDAKNAKGFLEPFAFLILLVVRVRRTLFDMMVPNEQIPLVNEINLPVWCDALAFAIT